MGLLNPGDWKGKWIGRDETALYEYPGSPFQIAEAGPLDLVAKGRSSPAHGGSRLSINIRSPRIIRHATFVLGADNGFEVDDQRKVRGPWEQSLDARGAGCRGSAEARRERDCGEGAPTSGTGAGVIGTLKVEFTTGEPDAILYRRGLAGIAGRRRAAGARRRISAPMAWSRGATWAGRKSARCPPACCARSSRSGRH